MDRLVFLTLSGRLFLSEIKKACPLKRDEAFLFALPPLLTYLWCPPYTR